MYREAEKNPAERPTVKLKNQMNLLWRSELMNIVKRFGIRGYSSRNKHKLRDLIVDKIGKEQSKQLTCELLINRDYSIYEEEGEQ